MVDDPALRDIAADLRRLGEKGRIRSEIGDRTGRSGDALEMIGDRSLVAARRWRADRRQLAVAHVEDPD